MMLKESNDKMNPRRIAVLLLVISLQLASAITKSPRRAFYPRGGASSSASSSSTASLLARRTITPTSSRSAKRIGFGRKKTPQKKNLNVEEAYDYNLLSKANNEPDLEDLRAQLGPIGILVSNTIELTVTTVGSYISGGALGYFGGGVMGMSTTLFAKDMGGFAQRLTALNSKAFTSCKSWATLSAAFSGFHNLVRLCRGGVEDNWNAVWGSALSGAFLNRAGGPQAMIQGGATYAGFTYFLDKFFGSSSSQQGRNQSSELLYTDVPIDD